MPESRYSGLAQSLANRGEGRGFWRGVGDVFSASPIGRLLHGDVRGAWQATPAYRAYSGVRGMFGGRDTGPAGTAVNAYGPTLGGYGGLPGPQAPASWGGTDWGAEISGGQPATAAGPWQGAPTLLPGQMVAPGYSGAASSAGAWAGQAGGLGRLMNASPMKQSGVTFRTFEQER